MSPALAFARVPVQSYPDPHLQQLHDALREADGTWRAARAHRADDDLLRDLVRSYIEASDAFQRARWGRVRVRLSVPGVLRDP